MLRGHLNSLNTPCSPSWYWPLSSTTTRDVGGIGFKKPSIMAPLSWKKFFLWMIESHNEQRNWVPTGTQSRYRTSASTVLHCWEQCWVTVSAANLQFNSSGIAALNFSPQINCLLVHADMVGVSSTSTDAGAGTVTELSRSLSRWRCWSKIIKQINNVKHS